MRRTASASASAFVPAFVTDLGSVLAFVTLLAGLVGTAHADRPFGPNVGGMLVLHASTSTEYTADDDYCGLSGLTDCANAVVRSDQAEPVVIHALAAFSPEQGSRLQALVFGIDYDASVALENWKVCGDFELPQDQWPEPGTGVAVTWADAQTDELVEVYWFAAYSAYERPGHLNLGPHPTQGAFFADDSVPAYLDPIVAFGSFGFYTDGFVACPLQEGTCCFADGSCQVLSLVACEESDGTYTSSDPSCDPNPCPEPGQGACCLVLGTCEFLSEVACTIRDGSFLGLGVVCAPNPCPAPCEPFRLAGRPSTTHRAPRVDPFSSGSSRRPRVGPNRGGTLVLHLDSEFVYSGSGVPAECDFGSVETCRDIVARVDQEDPVLLYAVALFPEGSEPRVVGLTFGIDFPDCVQLLEWETCGDFEVPNSDWPSPGSGTAVTWSTPQAGTAIPVYGFVASGYAAEPGEFALAPHPTHGALFADDTVPAILDPVAELGSFGFFRSGIVPCPQPQDPIGACCLQDGTCEILTDPACAAAGGEFVGVNVSCNPSPCDPPVDGACCFDDGSCRALDEEECAAQGGYFLGDAIPCDPNPCPSPEPCPNWLSFEARIELRRQAIEARERSDVPHAAETGRRQGATARPETSGPCGTLYLNADGTYENAYAWQYGGVTPPNYGAFAERYSTTDVRPCAIVLDLVGVGNQLQQTMDLYAWDAADGLPGLVLGVRTGVDPGSIGIWPDVSRHAFDFVSDCTDETFVGYWGNWPDATAGWYVGADLDGFGGCPVTLVAPGIGYPTGWHNVSIVWGPTQAIGIGGEFVKCGASPVRRSSWGEVKALFR
ncbi:MAG: hypothetical protein R3E97_05475 [Candidatus Eisenbacteria bacterium]